MPRCRPSSNRTDQSDGRRESLRFVFSQKSTDLIDETPPRRLMREDEVILALECHEARVGNPSRQHQALLDQTNYRKSVDQLLALLQVLNCDVDLVVRTKTA